LGFYHTPTRNHCASLIQALEKVQIPEVRQSLIQAGLKQAQKFSWETMAEMIANLCVKTVSELPKKPIKTDLNSLIWQEFRKLQTDQQ